MVAAILVTSLGVPALAADGERWAPSATTAERPTDTTVTTPTRPTVDRPPASDQRPTVRDRCAVDPQPRRCPDRPDEFNVRQLIWRLIKAGEWRKLFHLLHRLGII
jgi:hypothetical protein